jgi:uncharacterized glyoxalase superfamily protein PhnB
MANESKYGPIQVSLTANDIARSIAFYTNGLGFSIADKHEADGKVVYAELKAGSAEIGVSQDNFAKGRDRVKGTGVRLYLTTPEDLNKLADRAKAAGIKLDSEVAKMPWGQLAFSVTDPDGFAITIANGS